MYLQWENKSTHRGENRNFSADTGSASADSIGNEPAFLFIC